MKLQVVFAQSFSWLTPNQTKLYPNQTQINPKKTKPNPNSPN